MGLRLVTGLRALAQRPRAARSSCAIVSGIAWRHVWPVPLVLAAVLVAVASVLMQVPGLDWGWWSAFGGDGNPVFGSTDLDRRHGVGVGCPARVHRAADPRPAAVRLRRGAAVPHAAPSGGTGGGAWSRCVQFGLVHALIGIPIGAALALSSAAPTSCGRTCARYRWIPSADEATLESARAHTVYNGVIVTLVAILIVVDTFG